MERRRGSPCWFAGEAAEIAGWPPCAPCAGTGDRRVPLSWVRVEATFGTDAGVAVCPIDDSVMSKSISCSRCAVETPRLCGSAMPPKRGDPPQTDTRQTDSSTLPVQSPPPPIRYSVYRYPRHARLKSRSRGGHVAPQATPITSLFGGPALLAAAVWGLHPSHEHSTPPMQWSKASVLMRPLQPPSSPRIPLVACRPAPRRR